jgi:hypothetical protein
MDDGLNFAQVVVFLDHFKDLPDHRQRGKVMYPLDEILLLRIRRFPSRAVRCSMDCSRRHLAKHCGLAYRGVGNS